MPCNEDPAVHPARPQATERPCPACGSPVDPLRAGRVVLLDDGFRFLCEESCRERFLAGERSHEPDSTPTPDRVSIPDRVREATLSSIRTGDSSVAETAGQRAVFTPTSVPIPWVGVSAAALAFLLGIFPTPVGVAFLSALLSVVAAATALKKSEGVRYDVGNLAWLLGPLGAILAAFAAFLARVEDPERWPALAGAAVAAAAMLTRAWLDARARQPVAELITALSDSLPRRARVPVGGDDATPERYEEIPTRRLRAGQEVLAVEGEVVPVDGVVQAGEAWALLHSCAQTPVRRGPGDPLLAGARITEGAIRILATRVGDDRALIRPARFAETHGPEAARISRVADAAIRWGGLASIGGAIASLTGLAIVDSMDTTVQLSAAAAVLLAAPLLSARRSADAPLAVAAAAAAERGIVFANARALSRAGKTPMVALCMGGVVTEGAPEVLEVRSLGESDPDALMALVAAAEKAASPHPIGRAIRRYVERRGIEPESVRRAVHSEGRGVTALGPGGEPLCVGNRVLLLEEGVSVAAADAAAEAFEARGLTALFVSLGGKVRAVVALTDELRAGTRAAVQRLFDLDIEVALLAGDHHTTVENVAQRFGIVHIKAELLPEERGSEVRRLAESARPVAVFGRVGHDDAALAAADIPVILGAAGGHTGESTIALATEDARDGAAALWIARATRLETWRGVAIAMGAGGLLVACAALGWAVPAIAAVGAVTIDAFALPAGARLLRRIELRVPARR